MKSKIAVIGVGGRTGAMFAFELSVAAEVLGVAKEKEVEMIREGRFYIKRKGENSKLLKIKTIKDSEFPAQSLPEIIFLATKNPVGPIVEYYYQKIKQEKKLPALVLSQNGLSAGKEAKRALEKILAGREKEVQIIRVSLLNPVEKEELGNKILISYSLPIQLSFGVFSGEKEVSKFSSLFKKAGIEAEEISPEKVRPMEFSKLFLNLIGMNSATKGLSLQEGFNSKETFKEEINSLREYIKVVRAAAGNFINLSPYPIKLFVFLIAWTPLPILIFFRKKIWQIINQARGGKEKENLDEIDFYQGEVVKLGREVGILTPVNEEILKRAKAKN